MTDEKEYYKIKGSDVCEELDVSPEAGLSEEEVRKRKEKYGPNRIEMREPPSWLSLFLDHLTEFVSILLIIVGTVALATYFLGHGGGLEHLAESVIIYVIVVINATVGAHQEHKSEQTAQRLREMVKTECTVRREGEFEEIDSEDLVPGDVVYLESGDKVPADLRLLDAENLGTQESVLTGESQTVEKKTERIGEDRPLAER
ncbi:MAG: HAD-IC family P-type ATPase, partial [Candidatus Aenigmatarchaeota archaeon]